LALSASAQAPILAHLSAAHGAVDPTWVVEVVAAPLTAPVDRPQGWQVHLTDAAIRAGNRDRAAALARHWAGEIPTSPWVLARADAEGTMMLRFHAAAAALAGTALPIDNLVPSSLRPEEIERGQPDPRGHDRRQWTIRAEPLLEILILTVRAATGDAHPYLPRALREYRPTVYAIGRPIPAATPRNQGPPVRSGNRTKKINAPTWTSPIRSTIRSHSSYLFAQVRASLRIVVDLTHHYSRVAGEDLTPRLPQNGA